VGTRSGEPFTNTEAELISQRLEAVRRFKLVLANKVQQLQPAEIPSETLTQGAAPTEDSASDISRARRLPIRLLAVFILLTIFIGAEAIYGAAAPTKYHQYSRSILISFHGTALVEESYDNGPSHFRIRGDVCGPPPDYGGCFPWPT